jgi:hypothetical protein
MHYRWYLLFFIGFSGLVRAELIATYHQAVNK